MNTTVGYFQIGQLGNKPSIKQQRQLFIADKHASDTYVYLAHFQLFIQDDSCKMNQNRPRPTSLFLDVGWSILSNGIFNLFAFSLFLARQPPPQWARASTFTRFLDHIRRGPTVGRTPLDEWSARRRDLYLTTHNTHNRQTSMPPGWYSNPQSQQTRGRSTMF